MSTGKRRANDVRSRAIIEALAEIWPGCFHVYEVRRPPLKVSIADDVIAGCAKAIASGYLTRNELRNALRYYVPNIGYLRNCRPGAQRIGLDGNACGIVTVDQAKHAADLRGKFRITRKQEKASALSPKRSRGFQFTGH